MTESVLRVCYVSRRAQRLKQADRADQHGRVGIITIEVARPDFPVADRSGFSDASLLAAARGFYVIRDFAPAQPRHGYVLVQGASSTSNLLKQLPALEAAGINVKVISAVSEDLFDRQPEEYRNQVLPPEAETSELHADTHAEGSRARTVAN